MNWKWWLTLVAALVCAGSWWWMTLPKQQLQVSQNSASVEQLSPKGQSGTVTPHPTQASIKRTRGIFGEGDD